MSDIIDTADAPMLLAGEYVLGVLDPDERRAIDARAERDEVLASEILAWEALLRPFVALIPAVRPPADLWPRIARDIGAPVVAAVEAPVELDLPPPITPEMRSIRRWRIATFASLALAAALAGVIFVPSGPKPVAFASLAPMGPDSAAAYVVRVLAEDRLQINALTPRSVPLGHDLELWLLVPNAKAPVSLGVLRSEGVIYKKSKLISGGGRLLISLEPKGGSPTGLPTGPVLYGGLITRM